MGLPTTSAPGANPRNDAAASTGAPVPGGDMAQLLAADEPEPARPSAAGPSQGHSPRGSKIAGVEVDGGLRVSSEHAPTYEKQEI